MKRPRGLLPLSAQALPGRETEARNEEAALRLRQAWGLVVGPALVRQTRLLRIHRGTLVVGCWQPEWLKAVREASEAVWPQVRERVQRLLGVRLTHLDVVPCDPPKPEQANKPAEDPFKALLQKYRDLAKKPK